MVYFTSINPKPDNSCRYSHKSLRDECLLFLPRTIIILIIIII